MKGKVLFVVGLGVGYVLGTRAGRERYEQIKRAAEGVWNTPAVQQGVDTVKGFAADKVGDLSDSVLDGVKSFIGNATRGSGATRQDVSDAAAKARQGVAKGASATKSAVDDVADTLSEAIDSAAATAAGAAKPAKSTKAAPKRGNSSRGA
ncbi:YtxH domain-containing protein [Agromyces sp. NPDC058104]|uniref:YtxH domain-containing protein n=1 Tax=Agromyces sp. NPDC058104 TaxID=3346342 RepID=UPI0036DB0E26